MGSSRLRTGLVVVAAAAIALGGVAIPATTASAAAAAPVGLLPNDPNSAPTSQLAGQSLKNVVLKWTPVLNAASYQVQVANERGSFESPSIDATTTVAAYAPTATLPHADYAWRVRVTGGTWSPTAYFTRGWDDAPANAESVPTSGGPLLTWDAVPDASYYEIQLSGRPFDQGTDPVDGGDGTADASSGITDTCLTANTEFTPYKTTKGKDDGIIPGETTTKCTEISGSFYWRVRARDGAYDPATSTIKAPAVDCTGVWYGKDPIEDKLKSECSDWGYPSGPYFASALHTGLPVAAAAPDNLDIGPRLGTSSDSPVEISSTPSFSWDPVANATFYRVYQTRDTKATTTDHTWETTSTHLDPVILETDNDLRTYWRVQACTVEAPDADGFVLTYDKDSIACGPVSGWESYVVHTPSTVDNLGYTVVPNGWKLRWTTAADPSKDNSGNATHLPDAAGYDVQISDALGSFETPVKTVKVDRQQDSQTPTPGESEYWLPSAGISSSGFLWRVRGVDSSGNKYPWSTPTLVGQLAHSVGKLATGTNFALNASLNISFTLPVSNATAGAKIVATSNGAVFPGHVSATNDEGTAYRFTPSRYWVPGEYYRLQVSGVTTDGTGSLATAETGVIRAARGVDNTSPVLSRTVGDYGWTTGRASDALGYSYIRSDDKTSTSKRSSVAATVRGTSVDVYACGGTTSGYASISVDGVYKTKVNLYKSYGDCYKVARVPLAAGSAHQIRFSALGTKSAKSKGHQVRFDAFIVN